MKEKIEFKSTEKEWVEMTDAINKYMLKKGWNILVIGSPRVEQTQPSLKYNYNLVFNFTGKQIVKS